MSHSLDQPMVSIIVVSHNMAQHLDKAIDSLLQQTYPNLEIHIVDDGSTDNTAKVLTPYEALPNVHFHYQNHTGTASALNRGIRAAKGQYIAFCNPEDTWLPNKLNRQLPAFKLNDRIGVVYTNFELENKQESFSPLHELDYVSGDILLPLYIKNRIPLGTAIVKHHCFKELGMFDEFIRVSEDWDLWLRFATRYEFYYVDQVLHRYLDRSSLNNNNSERFASHQFIREKFLNRYGSRLPRATVNKGWSEDYMDRGELKLAQGHQTFAALLDFFTALRFQPSNKKAWKAILKTLVNYDNWSI